MSQPCLVHPGHYQKLCHAKGIKAANKEVNKVAKSMKLAMEYTRGGNGSASTIQAAAIVSRNQTTF